MKALFLKKKLSNLIIIRIFALNFIISVSHTLKTYRNGNKDFINARSEEWNFAS